MIQFLHHQLLVYFLELKKLAIARQTKNNFQEIVSEITSIGGNLLLKGRKISCES